jgi:DNA polymerase IV
MATTATILHADLDAFYASVEQLLDPSLRGRPIAVGGGVVLAASYEAKAFGVRGGMPGRQARELCPQLTFVSGHFKDYQRLGDAAIKVVGDFTPLVERISIDEAFADVAGCTHLFGSPEEIARAIRQRVRVELGLPISVGVARTKHLAKIASQVAKPDGLVVVDPDTELQFLHQLPVELMWGVPERITHDIVAEPGIFQNCFPGRPDLPGKRLGKLLGSIDNTPLGFLLASSSRISHGNNRLWNDENMPVRGKLLFYFMAPSFNVVPTTGSWRCRLETTELISKLLLRPMMDSMRLLIW